MSEPDPLTAAFEKNRSRLRALAYRMLGSLAEADDAVQEAWLRYSRAATTVDNPDAWLTTVVVRVCLNVLRSRAVRREESLGVHVPDPVVSRADGPSPEDQALLADSVGLALQVVLETLAPAERLAFVLHDLFGVPFDEIAPMVERSPAATRQLASRARRRIQGAEVRGADLRAADSGVGRQREVVDAFFAAAHRGDLEALVAVLDPGVVSRIDGGTARPEASVVLRGAQSVARRTLEIAHPSVPKLPVLVNGTAGVLIMLERRPVVLMGFTVLDGRIAEIDAIVDPERLSRLNLAALVA